MRPLVALFVLFVAASPATAAIFRPAVVYPQPVERPDSIAVADFNGDGRDDVAATESFCTFGCHVMVFLQAADGTLGEPAVYPYMGLRASAIQAGHFNGDQRLDFAVASGGVFVFLQQPDGSFSAPLELDAPRGAYDLASADVNGDGRLDLAAMPWGRQTFYVYEQQAAGGFVRKDHAIDGEGYDDFDLADLNGDGRADAINVSGQGFGGRLHLAYANADGGFGNVITLDLPWKVSFEAVETGDFDGDGRIDLAVLSHGLTNSGALGILLQKADGTFAAGPVLPVAPADTLLARDLDGDGDTDFAVASTQVLVRGVYEEIVEVGIQTAPGVFGLQRYVLPEIHSNFATHDHLAVGDVNGDGIRDLVVGLDNGALTVLAGRDAQRRRPVRQ